MLSPASRVPANVLRIHDWFVAHNVYPSWEQSHDQFAKACIQVAPEQLFNELVRLHKALTDELYIKLATSEELDAGGEAPLPALYATYNAGDEFGHIWTEAIDDVAIRRAFLSLVS